MEPDKLKTIAECIGYNDCNIGSDNYVYCTDENDCETVFYPESFKYEQMEIIEYLKENGTLEINQNHLKFKSYFVPFNITTYDGTFCEQLMEIIFNYIKSREYND